MKTLYKYGNIETLHVTVQKTNQVDVSSYVVETLDTNMSYTRPSSTYTGEKEQETSSYVWS